MKFFELQTDFFLPLWRRVAVIAVCMGWSVVEFGNGAYLWSVLFVALAVYALWQWFFDGWPASDATDKIE